ncbi:telomere-protecting terminal protein Tpg [Kitasatospora sp. NPDC059646]|uniref:telomere-protecting terminal protein Tpg n=1 Tax=Kitasatospora sp. NPDC059646 TaxID=3346893 RepID=UPI00367AB359
MPSKIIDALKAKFGDQVQTRDIAKTAQGRLNALVRAETPKGGKPDTARLAERLGVSRRQVQRYLSGKAKISGAKKQTLDRLESEVRKDHQPRVFAKVKREAQRRGMGLEIRASFGFSSAAGSTDDPRMRRLTENVPSHLIPDMLDAWREGDEQRLRELVAEGLAEEYFVGASGSDVELTDINDINFWT